MTALTSTALVNPYWELVAPHITEQRVWGGPVLDWSADRELSRTALVDRYAWTITDPATVAFVAEHAGPALVDPLAGSGYWLHLLRQLGVDVAGYDRNPPSQGDNHWHKAGVEHVEILAGDAVDVAARHSDRTLLLAWPPYDQPTGAEILRAYQGQRVIYIGEPPGGCCGDDAMFRVLAEEWTEIAEHRPVQYAGIHDWVTVYDRREG